MQRLNIKLLVGLIVSVVVTVISVAAIHAFQIDKNAGLLKQQGEKAETEGDLRTAVKKYSQYLRHRPNDIPTQGKMALLAADIADLKDADVLDVRHAMRMLEAASKHKELVDVRRRNADFLIRIQRFVDALDYIEELRESAAQAGKNDPELDIKYAICKIKTLHEDEAVHLLNEMIGFDPTSGTFDVAKATAPESVEAYLQLSSVLRTRFDDVKHADEVMQQLVVANPDQAKAHLALGRYEQAMGHTDKARAELDSALKLAPHDVDVILTAAQVAMVAKDFERAHELMTQGLKEFPDKEAVYQLNASLSLAEKKPEEAIEHLRAGLKVAPKSQNLLLFLADVQLQLGDLEGLRASLGEIRQGNFVHEMVAYFKARTALQEHKWLSASRQLEKLRPLMNRFPQQRMNIDMFLGQCYEKLGQPDKQLEAYRRVMDADSSLIQAHVGVAQALFALGKRQEGAAEIGRVNQAMSVKSPIILGNMLQLLISDELQKSVDERDWVEVDKLAAEMKSEPGRTEIQDKVLDAELLAVKGDLSAADVTLAGLSKKNPTSADVWLARINLLQQQMVKAVEDRGKLSEDESKELLQNNVAKLLRMVASAEKATGKKAPFRAIRIQAYARLAPEKAKAALAKASKSIPKLPEAEQIAAWTDMATAYYRLRDYEDLRHSWSHIIELKPDDPKLKLTMFEVAVEFQDKEGMKSAIDELGKLVGTDSALYKYALASQLVWEVRQTPGKDKPTAPLVEARQLVSDALGDRPEWHELFKVRGEIDELENKVDAAIADYQKSLELGQPNSAIARRLVVLLYQNNRIAEVQQAMHYVGRTGGATDVIEKIGAETQSLLGQTDASLEKAKKIVEEKPDDLQNRIWYGQLLARAGNPAEAEEQYREAVKLAPESAYAWLTLIAQLASQKQIEQAVAAIETASHSIKAEQLNPALAQAYDSVGDRAKAEKYVLAALAEHPDDPALLRGAATLYLKYDQLAKAQPMVDKMLALKPSPDDRGAAAKPNLTAAHIAWARRTKAQIMARTGDFQDIQDAIKLLESDKPEGKANTEDTLMIARFLAGRSDAGSRQRAVQLLEQLATQRPLSAQEELMLAGLYERAGEWSKARERMLSLVTKYDSNPIVLANFIQMMLRHDELEGLGHWIDKLVQIKPKAPSTIQLKARWLVKQGKTDEATEYVEGLVPADLKPGQYGGLAKVAFLLEELHQYPAAEKLFRQYYDLEPHAILYLAGFLGRHGKLNEAFELLDSARKTEPLPGVVDVASQTLRARADEATKAQFAKVDGWLAEALAADPQSVGLLLQLANLRDVEGRSDEVIAIYRQLLARPEISEKQQAVIKNNLAFSLAGRGSPKDLAEAEKTIDEAMSYFGPVSDVLDTHAVVMLVKGDIKQAKSDVEAAIQDSPGASKYLHQAMIAERADDKATMIDAFKKAVELKLDPDQLPPNEKKAYERLHAEVGDQ